ncbi:MAG: response regulator [Flavobacterium sp.]|nr:response regulator [Flavobacterium sp.]
MKTTHILLVEDNEADILLTTEALEEGIIFNKISVVRDGEQAMHFLKKRNEYANAELPNIILLDINLPRQNGLEVLKLIKADSNIKHIPIIMLTTSSSKKDIQTAYKNYANCYIIKPVDVNDFINAITKIEEFWVNMARLP